MIRKIVSFRYRAFAIAYVIAVALGVEFNPYGMPLEKMGQVFPYVFYGASPYATLALAVSLTLYFLIFRVVLRDEAAQRLQPDHVLRSVVDALLLAAIVTSGAFAIGLYVFVKDIRL